MGTYRQHSKVSPRVLLDTTYCVGKAIFLRGGLNLRARRGTVVHWEGPDHSVTHLQHSTASDCTIHTIYCIHCRTSLHACVYVHLKNPLTIIVHSFRREIENYDFCNRGKRDLDRSRKVQISASQHIPVRSYECAKIFDQADGHSRHHRPYIRYTNNKKNSIVKQSRQKTPL